MASAELWSAVDSDINHSYIRVVPANSRHHHHVHHHGPPGRGDGRVYRVTN